MLGNRCIDGEDEEADGGEENETSVTADVDGSSEVVGGSWLVSKGCLVFVSSTVTGAEGMKNLAFTAGFTDGAAGGDWKRFVAVPPPPPLLNVSTYLTVKSR